MNEQLQNLAHQISELETAVERYRLAMAFTKDGLFDWNLRDNSIYYSPAWKALLGYGETELPDTFSVWQTLTHPDDVPLAFGILKEVLEGKRHRFEIELRMKHKDGHWVDILVRANILADEHRQPLRMIGTHVDISQRKKMERQLLEAKQQADRFLNLAGVLFIGLDHRGEINLANETATEVLGLSRDQLLGLNWFEAFIPERERASTRAAFASLMSGETSQVEEFENHVVTSSGEERLISWKNTFIRNSSGTITGILGSGMDITEKRRMETRLLQTQKMEAIQTLAGGIAHDFNNLLGIIAGNASGMQDPQTPQDPRQSMLQDILVGVEQAQALTRQLLTFAKGGQPVKSPCDLNELLRKTTQLTLSGSRCHWRFQTLEEVLPCLLDPHQMGQVISNLLINAMQSMPEGGFIGISSGRVVKGGESPMAYFTIEDQGHGIPEELMHRVMEPFFSTKPQGSGLGLASAFAIVQGHQGHLELKSHPDMGTQAIVTVPMSPNVLLAEPPPDQPMEAGCGRILLMDDQEAILRMTSRLLGTLGYEVQGVADGDAAVAACRDAEQAQKPFHAAILDLTIPGGKGGLEVLPLLKAITPQLQAIVSSGYSEDPVMAQFKEFGFAAIAPKPYTKRQLAQALKTALATDRP
jgi:PAS domain S-box-containing protein